jgi:hypothetical protein
MTLIPTILTRPSKLGGPPRTPIAAWLEIETKISHPATAKMLQEIKDPDIRAMESIMFARALLGIPMQRVMTQEKTKSGNRVRNTFEGP